MERLDILSGGNTARNKAEDSGISAGSVAGAGGNTARNKAGDSGVSAGSVAGAGGNTARNRAEDSGISAGSVAGAGGNTARNKAGDVPIRAVAERLGIQMKRKGTAYWAQCLWHADSHPSMIVGGKVNVCHCFACGKTASVIDLVMTVLNTDFKGACCWLESEGFVDDNRFENIRKGTGTPRRESHRFENIRKGAGTSRRESHRFENIRKGSGTSRRESHRLEERAEWVREHYNDDKGEAKVVLTACVGDKYGSSFARCLKEVFGEERMKDVVDFYNLGAWKAHGRYDDVLFPSIDKDGVWRDQKAQSYECNPETPGFFHCDKKHTYWVGPIVYPDAKFDRECLFGEFLLSLYPEMTVVLVESPKNACVGWAMYPQYLWVATGNKNMLKRSVLTVLKGRRVIVFPDEDAFDEWSQKLSEMKDIAMFQCIHPPGVGEKRDIADFILKNKHEDNNKT